MPASSPTPTWSSRARTIAEGTTTPLIADADTGFGGLINVRQTVRGYEAAGVQAIQIEDQEMPKKCGHTPNRRVMPARRHVPQDRGRGRCAHAATDTLIIARTDARTGTRPRRGDRAAARRSRKAGADIIFVEAPESEDEFRRVGDSIDALAARQHGADRQVAGGVGRATCKPWLQHRDLSRRPAWRVVCAALEANYALSQGDTARPTGSPVPAYTMAQLHELMGFPDVWEFEKRYAEP